MPEALVNKNIQVEAYDRQQNKLLATGRLLTIDNQIDTTTGTVKLRAIFDNKNNTLFSNQFVNIQLLVENLNNATVVSTAAIQHGKNGDFVYLLNTDSTVTVQPIKAGVTTGDVTVIQEGLTFGQQVVVEGADKLTSGAKVNITSNDKTSDQVKNLTKKT